jgi:hypothetical protein
MVAVHILYQAILYFRSLIGLNETHFIGSFFGRFSHKSQLFNSILCWYLTPSFTSLSTLSLPLNRFSQYATLLDNFLQITPIPNLINNQKTIWSLILGHREAERRDSTQGINFYFVKNASLNHKENISTFIIQTNKSIMLKEIIVVYSEGHTNHVSEMCEQTAGV